MSSPTAFVIATAAHVPALRRRLGHDPTIAVFSEWEALEALRMILTNPPRTLVLDSTVVRSARGALVVSQLKAHAGVDVRVLTDDEAKLPVLLGEQDIALQDASRPLDGCGTRGAARLKMKPHVATVVDGQRCELVNLSISGAQIVVPSRVQPPQSVRLTLADEQSENRLRALVAWSAIELAGSTIMYRAGVSFIDPDVSAIAVFCIRNAAGA